MLTRNYNEYISFLLKETFGNKLYGMYLSKYICVNLVTKSHMCTLNKFSMNIKVNCIVISTWFQARNS